MSSSLNYIPRPSGGVDDGPMIAGTLDQTGSLTVLGPGTYKIRTALNFALDGLSLFGSGAGATTLLVDDSAGAVGDVITINSVLNAQISGLTISSSSARTAGAAVKVKGVNNITATPVQRTRQYTITDVDFVNQFDGLSVVDGTGSKGAWGGYMSRCDFVGNGAGGTIIDINTPNGGQQFLTDIKAYGAGTGASATRALAGVRVRGCNDVELSNVNIIYTQYGLLVDPPSGQNANVILARGCFWDSVSVLPCKIAPASGGTANLVRLVENWFGVNSALGTIDCINISGAARSISIQGGYIIGPQILCKVDGTGGATDINVVGAVFSGGTTGFYATGSTLDFRVQNNSMVGNATLGAAAPAIGVLIDAGCDHYSVTGNTLRSCSTPITNTPGTSAGRRIVQDNITA